MSDILEGTNPFQEPTFSLRNRFLRIIWGVVYGLCFKFTPVSFFVWRSSLLKIFGARIGKGCHVYPKAVIWAPWNLEMGDFSCLANDVLCNSMDKITLGEKAVVSQGARLITGSHDYTDPNFKTFTRPIYIGKGAWIAAEVFIMPGVNIGDQAVIGARSLVTKDMPEWTVCFGNPCRPVKPRQLRKT